MDLLLWVLAAIPVLVFGAVLFAWKKTAEAVPAISALSAPEPAAWPKLSIVVPACNEAEHIESALETLLAADYPNLEIVAVDDRSTDDTPAILKLLHHRAPDLRVVRVRELPPDWLGKVNALAQGWAASSGEWVLLADADVHLERGALRKIVAWCEANRVDHFTAVPTLWPSDLLSSACWAHSYVLMVGATRLWAVPDPEAPAHIGVGAFNLVRRAAFEEAGGFEWFKLDVADDWAVGLMMKRARRACRVAVSRGAIHLPWYSSFAQMTRGMEKNMFAILAEYSVLRGLGRALAMLALIGIPFAALSSPAWPLGAAALGLMALDGVLVQRWVRGPLWHGLLVPLGGLLNVFILLRGLWLGFRRGGVAWRGTLYPTELMRGQAKVRF